uniref:Uncharacterized protein n=1 Tax=Myotis myotis TaxID=51298 RepID=A0A7J7ZY97_MYOMY|nr:hypothetical protein mMyoMyo1_009899 [Myotis myotis]
MLTEPDSECHYTSLQNSDYKDGVKCGGGVGGGGEGEAKEEGEWKEREEEAKVEEEEERQRQKCMHTQRPVSPISSSRTFKKSSMETEILVGNDLDFDTVTFLKYIRTGTKKLRQGKDEITFYNF